MNIIPTIRAKGHVEGKRYYIMEDMTGCYVVYGDDEVFDGTFYECREYVFRNILGGYAEEVKRFYGMEVH